MQAFIPNGWVVLDNASGGINKDGQADIALVIQHKDSVLLVNGFGDAVLTKPRIIFVLFRSEDQNGYILAKQNNFFIMSHDAPVMNDPFEQLVYQCNDLQVSVSGQCVCTDWCGEVVFSSGNT